MTESMPTDGQKVNGHSTNEPGTQQNGVGEQPITKILAKFIVETPQDAITSELSTKLKALILDYFGVSSAAGFAAESTPKFLAGITAFAGGATGTNTIFTKGSSFLPQYAALTNGALCHSYDFDDTHGPAILHPGASVISAALAQSEIQDASGSDFLLAMAIGYEVTVRLGIALGGGSYAHGFHNTATAGIFGSIAAICKLKHASQPTVENALGLGVSKAGGSMQFLDNGSWNKRLHPGFAAHDAFLCVALAEAGVIGATKPIEGKYGALHNFSGSSNPSGITVSLGTAWEFLGTACKPFPACRMTHGMLEMAGKARRQQDEEEPKRGLPSSITIHLPPANYPIVGLPSPNKIHPQTIVDAQFSVYFQTAAALLHGNNLGWTIYDLIGDKDIETLSSRITCAIDDKYTNLESRATFTYDDGTVIEDEVVYPLGEKQKPFEWDTGVQTKFLGLAGPVYGREKAGEICRVVEKFEGQKVKEVMRMLA